MTIHDIRDIYDEYACRQSTLMFLASRKVFFRFFLRFWLYGGLALLC